MYVGCRTALAGVVISMLTGCASSVALSVAPVTKVIPPQLSQGIAVRLGTIGGPPCYTEEIRRYLSSAGGLRLARQDESPRLTVSGRVSRIEAHSNRGDKEVLVLYYSAFVFTAPLAAAVYAAKDWQADAIAEGELTAADPSGNVVWSRAQAVSVSEVQRTLPTNDALKAAMLAAGCQKLAATLLNGLAEALAEGAVTPAASTPSAAPAAATKSPAARSGGVEAQLDALEDLHNRERITHDEYATLRRRVIEGLVASPAIPAAPSQGDDTVRPFEEQLEALDSMRNRGRISVEEHLLMRRRLIEWGPTGSLSQLGSGSGDQAAKATSRYSNEAAAWAKGTWKRIGYAGPSARLEIAVSSGRLEWQFSDVWDGTTLRADGTGMVSGNDIALSGHVTAGDERNVGTPLRLRLRREGSVLRGTLSGGFANVSAQYSFERER